MTETVRTRNPEGTKRAVLDAAERLFAARGFEGTSMRDIADASGVSQPLIQHHFGHKDQLYAAVLRRAIDGFVASLPEAARGTDRPVDLRTEIATLFAFARDNSLALRMFQWARLEGRHDLIAGAGCHRHTLIERIRVAQRRGLVRDDIEAAGLAMMLEGLVFFWVENRALKSEVLENLPDDDAYMEHAAAVLERGFAPTEGPTADPTPDGRPRMKASSSRARAR